MSTTHESIVPGLSQQQYDVLSMVIREAVAEGVREAFGRRDAETCARHCTDVDRIRKDVAGHHAALFGDDGSHGLVRSVADLESRMRLVLWVGATIAAASIVSVITAVATLIRIGG